jgi:beta-galactosidase
VYVGTYLTGPAGEALIPELVKLAGVQPALRGAPAGVEVIVREASDRSLCFLLNRTEQPQVVSDAPKGRDLITDHDVAGPITLAPWGVAIIRTAR